MIAALAAEGWSGDLATNEEHFSPSCSVVPKTLQLREPFGRCSLKENTMKLFIRAPRAPLV
jgi:hypothetical protein